MPQALDLVADQHDAGLDGVQHDVEVAGAAVGGDRPAPLLLRHRPDCRRPRPRAAVAALGKIIAVPTWLLIVIVLVVVIGFAFFGAPLLRIAGLGLGRTLRAVAGDRRVDRAAAVLDPQEPGVELFTWVRAHGYELRGDDADVIDPAWGPPLTRGGAHNVFTGTTAGFPVTGFAQLSPSTIVQAGNAVSSTAHHAVLTVRLAHPRPDVSITRANPVTRHARHDVRFGDARLDHEFTVVADDASAAAALLTAPLRATLLDYSGPGVRIVGNHVIEIVPGVTDVGALDARIGSLTAIAAALG